MTDQNDDNADYKVGYGKPPLKTQFRKGESGNPRGRRPKIEPSRTRLQQQVDFFTVTEQPITVTVNGKSKTISGYQAAILKLQQKVLSGDKHAMSLYFNLAKDFMSDFSEANPEATRLVEGFHRARMMQRDPLTSEDIEYLNKIHKKTRE